MSDTDYEKEKWKKSVITVKYPTNRDLKLKTAHRYAKYLYTRKVSI